MSHEYDTFLCASEQPGGKPAAHVELHSRIPASGMAESRPDEFDLLLALVVELRRAAAARDTDRFALLSVAMSQELHLMTLDLDLDLVAALILRDNGQIAPFDEGVAQSLRLVIARLDA